MECDSSGTTVATAALKGAISGNSPLNPPNLTSTEKVAVSNVFFAWEKYKSRDKLIYQIYEQLDYTFVSTQDFSK